MAALFQDVVIRLQPLRLDDPVSMAAEVMWRHETPSLPVVDSDNVYAGAVSIFSLLKRRAHSQTKVKSFLEKVPILEDFSDPIKVARAFVRTGFPGLPAGEGGRPAGVISARRLILSMGLKPQVPAGLLTYPLKPLTPDDPIEKARKLMADVGLRLLPVASGSKLVGVVKIYDLVRYVYVTPVERRRSGEVAGSVEYYLDQPVKGLLVEAERVVESGTVPTVQDIAEGCIVTDEKGEVIGVISPYLLLRRLLPAVEEATLPLRVEGLEGLDFIAQRLIYVKSLETARSVAERARLLEMSVVLKGRKKASSVRYDAFVSIKLDVGVHSARAESWEPVQAVTEALDAAYKRFSKTKEKIRERKINMERIKRRLFGE
ncbi:MAG: CBS domain-containing protein [Thermofilaceae archaeon]|nr:CBS domain-containing protein [Thermofilaceae archaeon]